MNPAKVNVSTAFETIIDISESSHTLEIKFKIQLEWYEYRTKERVIQIVSFSDLPHAYLIPHFSSISMLLIFDNLVTNVCSFTT